MYTHARPLFRPGVYRTAECGQTVWKVQVEANLVLLFQVNPLGDKRLMWLVAKVLET